MDFAEDGERVMLEGMPKISIIVPTYNEVDNVEDLIVGLRSILGDADYQIVVVDDNSPDGTFYAVKQIAERDSHILPLLRQRKAGLASAILHGFRASDGKIIVMMDSDLSHRPQDLIPLLEAVRESDIVIGSRYVEGGSIFGMSAYRKLASRVSIWVSRRMLGLPYQDTTSGFAAFRRGVLEYVEPKLEPTGFKLLLEVLVKCPQAQVSEIPITFVNRRIGKSKFGAGEVFKFLGLCFRLRRNR